MRVIQSPANIVGQSPIFPLFEVPNWHLKLSSSFFGNSNIKSFGKRSIFRLTALFKFPVVTPYYWRSLSLLCLCWFYIRHFFIKTVSPSCLAASAHGSPGLTRAIAHVMELFQRLDRLARYPSGFKKHYFIILSLTGLTAAMISMRYPKVVLEPTYRFTLYATWN